eukprot:CAMPEP_0178918250 /NCGR_PEP_ID=MMETSP0786-20121207/13726_1 /TAXON_ID=186022 /ORGANISM="Thalassionema frauenfeldii, Strain CCMP 1798" /LENGTH=295 /DNA_ID=CAMNT_0020591947 /DNA_START=213 /DNA_END=1100 /DNA_ORIENTATION=-
MPLLQDELPFPEEDAGHFASCYERPLTFPFRLHNLLTQASQLGVDDIVSWDGSGTKLIIYDLEKFVSKILPTVFRQSQFASFRRQMNAYGYERETKSTRTVYSTPATLIVYSHKNFYRDNIAACSKIIRRKPSKQQRKSLESHRPIPSTLYLSSNKEEELQQPLSPNKYDFDTNFLAADVEQSDNGINLSNGELSDELLAHKKADGYHTKHGVSLARLYERRIHNELKLSHHLAKNKPVDNLDGAKMFDNYDVLDELAAMMSNSDLSGCDNVDSISWDPSVESFSSRSSITSRVA